MTYALLFFVLAIIAGLFGFSIVASAFAGIAKILFWVFVVAFIFLLITGGSRRGPRL